jgi:hypothetical protein
MRSKTSLRFALDATQSCIGDIPRYSGLICLSKVVDSRLVNEFNLFILKAFKAWTDPAQNHPKTIHLHGYGKFSVDGEMIKLKSREP